MAKTDQVGQHATTIATDSDGFIVVTYHQTQVVKFNRKKIILNTGGYNTASTRLRMNQASNQYSLGFRVFQKKFKLFVEFNDYTQPFDGRVVRLNRL